MIPGSLVIQRIGAAVVLAALSLALVSLSPVLAREPRSHEAFVVDTAEDAADAQVDDGRCATADGACSLRAAIQAANARSGPDVIELPAGTYRLSEGGPVTAGVSMGDRGGLDIDGDLRIIGMGGREATVLRPSPDGRLFRIACQCHVEIESVTIRGDRQPGDAPVANQRAGAPGRAAAGADDGPIRIGGRSPESLTVTNTIFRDLSAGYDGGAISADGWSTVTLSIARSIFLNNSAGYEGGAISIGGWGTVKATVTDSLFQGNKAGYEGGAIAAGSWGHIDLALTRVTLAGSWADYEGGAMALGSWGTISATVIDSTIRDNQADYEGGGISMGSWGTSSLVMHGTTISGNRSPRGGGIHYDGSGGIELVNSTISGNQAANEGGGLAADDHHGAVGRIRLVNSTLIANTAPSGGGVHSDRSGGVVAAVNSVIAIGGAGAACEGTSIIDEGHNLADDQSCGFASSPADPRLGPLADNGGLTLTHAPLTGSPLIDAADGQACPATDQRGAPRPAGAACDIGAVEAGAVAPEVTPAALPTFSTPEPTASPLATTPAPPSATPSPRPSATATPLPSATPTPVPSLTPVPSPTPTATSLASCVCDRVRERVPASVINAALADPAGVYGWRLPLDPGKPAGPANPPRICLELRNPALASYHPSANPVEWRVGCR